MPLVQHNSLPSFERVSLEGIEVRSPDKIDTALPSVKIGFLNMMPDTAITATERQFLRLVGASSDVNCYFYPFTIKGVDRSEQAQEYIDQFYTSYEKLKKLSLDAIIITGANVSQPLLQNESFWPELVKVLQWAKTNVCSVLCSCLATHAAVKIFYDIDRQHLGDKCWGVFEHKVLNSEHALMRDVEAEMKMCHSRFNDIPKALFEERNIDVLINSEQAGVQLAAEKDNSIIYFQGHPEYDDISLLKEYKREVSRYISGEINDYPPVPLNYFNAQAMECVAQYQSKVEHAGNKRAMLELFPEEVMREFITNPWKRSASQIFANWISFVARSCI